MRPDVTGFLERFTRFGRAPSVESYLALFHADATLFDSGMERPITVPEIPEHIEGILKLVPDFRMIPERWRERDGTLFVEASNHATIGPTPARWPSVYCIDLAGDHVIRGRRYYDRRPLFALLNPGLPVLPEVGYGALARLFPDLRLELQHQAGDGTLVFVEWRATVGLGGKPYSFGLADRLELSDGVVVNGRAYYDTLELAARRAAAD